MEGKDDINDRENSLREKLDKMGCGLDKDPISGGYIIFLLHHKSVLAGATPHVSGLSLDEAEAFAREEKPTFPK